MSRNWKALAAALDLNAGESLVLSLLTEAVRVTSMLVRVAPRDWVAPSLIVAVACYLDAAPDGVPLNRLLKHFSDGAKLALVQLITALEQQAAEGGEEPFTGPCQPVEVNDCADCEDAASCPVRAMRQAETKSKEGVC